MTNMTYVNAIDIAIEAISDSNVEAVEKLEALKAQLEKRNSKKSNSMTKTQKENIEVKERIVAALADSAGMTATMVSEVLDITLAKATALLTQLVKEEKVVRTKDKKVILFSVA